MKIYETVSEAVKGLSKAGYNYNFNILNDCICCEPEKISLNANEFEIDEVHRFEGETDPADQAIVYAISASNGSVKGLLVNAYGVYADSISADLVNKLSVR